MTKPIASVHEALEEIHDSIKHVKLAIENYRKGVVGKEWLAAIEKEMRVNGVLEGLHLHMVRLCLQDKDVAKVLVKVKLISRKDLAILSDKEEEAKFQAALDELSAALEEARALLKGPFLIPSSKQK